jgi:hypothetical protein
MECYSILIYRRRLIKVTASLILTNTAGRSKLSTFHEFNFISLAFIF